MRLKLAIAAAFALMLTAAPTALADGTGPASGGDRERVGNGYPPLPPECEPTADRTAIECTYDYGDRIDVQPAYGCWTLDEGSELCVDPPEMPNLVGCDYGAGECEIVVDPDTDRCVIGAFGPEIDSTIFLIRNGSLSVIEWNWGADPAADEALRQSWSEIIELIVAGDIGELSARCNAGGGDPTQEPVPTDPFPVLVPTPDDLGLGEAGIVLDEPGARADDATSAERAKKAKKSKKAKKAKKKSRGKKAKRQRKAR